MHKTGMFSALFKDCFDAVLFAECFYFTDEFNRNAVLLCDAVGIGGNSISKLAGKGGILKYPDLVRIQKGCHCLIVAPFGYSTLDNNTVITGNNTGNLIFVSVGYKHDYLHG